MKDGDVFELDKAISTVLSTGAVSLATTVQPQVGEEVKPLVGIFVYRCSEDWQTIVECFTKWLSEQMDLGLVQPPTPGEMSAFEAMTRPR